jgi:hypothetical protein
VAERINGILKDEYLECYKVYSRSKRSFGKCPNYRKFNPKKCKKELERGDQNWKNYYTKVTENKCFDVQVFLLKLLKPSSALITLPNPPQNSHSNSNSLSFTMKSLILAQDER